MAERQVITVRLSDTGISFIESVAQEVGVPRSRVLRAALRVATQHRDELVAHLKEQM